MVDLADPSYGLNILAEILLLVSQKIITFKLDNTSHEAILSI